MSTHLDNFIRYREDPLAFLTECVFTLDQVDQVNPVKIFPAHKEYIQLYVKLWQKFRFIAVPKSRRMTMSWTNIALDLWDTMFHKGRYYAFVSKKEGDAEELISKAEFIYDHIPENRIPKDLLPKKKVRSKPPVLEFPELYSKIQGFPQGADQLRQFTFSGILGDECAFWEQAQKFYAASKPTLDGGGRMCLISSRAPGFFKRLVYDQLDTQGDVIPDPPDVKKPMQGVELWQNPKNKFLVVDLHYTADPGKRSKEFREAVKASIPLREYLMEYERNWETFEGLPVFEDFSREIHESKEALEPQLGLPLILGWDFGLTPACIVAQQQGDQLVVLKEYVEQNMSIQKFAPKVMRDLKIRYPEWVDPEKDFLNFIDPAGFQRVQTDANTCALEMRNSAGIRNIKPGPLLWEERKKAVNDVLMHYSKDGPGFLICEKTAPTLFAGFTGGYQYPESAGDIEPTKIRPLKNKYSHPHDAFQYLVGGIAAGKSRGHTQRIPTPKYGFTKQDETSKRKLNYGY